MTLPDTQTQRQSAGARVNPGEPAAPRPPSPVMALLMPEGVNLAPARRTVVLVPDLDLDEAALARRIWSLAAGGRLSVLYVGLAASTSEEPQVRRRLATLAALTRDEWVSAATTLELGDDWLAALRPVLHAGDLIVCHAEQTVSGWRSAQSLGHELCRSLQKPVHLLSGFYSGQAAPPPAHPMGRVAFWGGSIVILAAAFWLQLQISALPKTWAESALMVLAVVGECGLIGLWSRAFN
jgi:hypothetical protein